MSSGRRIFIGDVQGCIDPLRRLLDATAFAQGVDRLYFVGDLVNKGPASAEVLRLAMELEADAVLGNHDVALLETAVGRRAQKASDTFDDVLAADDRDLLLLWLESRPLLMLLEDVVLVHAAIRPTWHKLEARAAALRIRFDALRSAGKSPFDDADVRFALSARYCQADGTQLIDDHFERGQSPSPPWRNWLDFWQGPEIAVFGHFAMQGLVQREFARGLDSGCCYGQQLTAWIAEEDRVVAVECVK